MYGASLTVAGIACEKRIGRDTRLSPVERQDLMRDHPA